MQEEKKSFTEEVKVTGAGLVDEVKRLVHEGNVTHILIKSEQGKTLLEIPLALGIVGIALLPVLAAVGAIVVLASNYTIAVTRTGP
jgi:hypothetical protein